MKKLLYITFLFIAFGCKSTSKIKTDTTTYYFIRHAEKDKSDKTNRDPDLIEKGRKRAQKWASYFNKTKLDAVYSTNYLRTKNTAKPTANSKGLETILYDPRAINYNDFLNNTKGQTVLIVGHSNTTPFFVNKIIGEEKYESIDETINSKLFIVTINKEIITSKVITID
ncbi:histidine phosphatase family protein [uncultured Lacinutrix sp.]|uniref:SixA phosphatase family protein n=1 Tax=uncultured Lacinutrix sp. TaxID=574032 RepID=UPI0026314696|nr:phosphoglycerate mutase family protein [uncultured Lacinutrix sp.]